MNERDKESPPQPNPADPVTARAVAAQQIKLAEEAARKVADLCAQAAEKGRRHKVPHAGVGGNDSSQI